VICTDMNLRENVNSCEKLLSGHLWLPPAGTESSCIEPGEAFVYLKCLTYEQHRPVTHQKSQLIT
jgi:hypothetical protein